MQIVPCYGKSWNLVRPFSTLESHENNISNGKVIQNDSEVMEYLHRLLTVM